MEFQKKKKTGIGKFRKFLRWDVRVGVLTKQNELRNCVSVPWERADEFEHVEKKKMTPKIAFGYLGEGRILPPKVALR